MSISACLQFAPVFHVDLVAAASERKRILYQAGCFRMLQDRPTPILIDHNVNQAIGHIIDLHIWPQPEGDFHVARCTLDEPPEWLTTRCKVSVGCAPLSETQHGGCRRVLTAILDEISILPPGVQPAEPHAHVAGLSDPPKTRQPTARSAPTPSPTTSNYGRPGELLVRPAMGEVLWIS